jgi:glycosyltransferase involved in cell wall biosynthesis
VAVRKVRVLVVDAVGAVGGAQASMLTFLRHYDRHHLDCQVLLLNDGPLRGRIEELGTSCAVVRSPRRLRNPAAVRTWASIYRHARSSGADVVYSNGTLAHLYAAPAAFFARRRYVWRLCDILRAGTGPVYRVAARLPADLTLVDSDAVGRAAREYHGGIGRMLTVYPGVESEPAARGIVRKELHIEKAPVLAVVGRLQRWKGQADVIAAMPAVLQAQADVHLLVVGEALFGLEPEYPQELRRQVAALGIGDHVHFLGHRDDIPAVLRDTDILLVPSRDPEPFGTVQAEAMMAAAAVVSTNRGGNPEVVQDGVTGLLVPPCDPGAFARAITGLLGDSPRRLQMGREGRTRALERFSAARMVTAMERVFIDLAERPSRVEAPTSGPRAA